MLVKCVPQKFVLIQSQTEKYTGTAQIKIVLERHHYMETEQYNQCFS
jgi:hypothetical protein